MSPAESPSFRSKRYRVYRASNASTISTSARSQPKPARLAAPALVRALLWLLASALIIFGMATLSTVAASTFSSRSTATSQEKQQGAGGEVDTASSPAVTPTSAVDCAAHCLAFSTPVPPVVVQVMVPVPYPVIQERTIVVAPDPPMHLYTYGAGFYSGTSHYGHYCSSSFSYVVQCGDTVYGLSRRFGVSPQAIISANALSNPNYIRIGQVLVIPCSSLY